MKKIFSVAILLALALAITAAAVPVDRELILHLNGEKLETDIDGSDTVVSNWQDLSESGNDVTQPNGDTTKMPKLISSGLNGFDTVAFDGVDIMSIAAPDADDFIPGTGGMTMFAVIKADTISAGNYLIRKGNFVSSADQGWSVGLDTVADGRIWTRLNAEDMDDNDYKAGRTHEIQIGQWVIYAFVIDPDGSGVPAAPGIVKTFLNGNENYLNTWYGGVYKGNINPPDSMFIGVNSDVEIAELVMYKTDLNDEELSDVGSYLAEKYAVETSYPQWTPPDKITDGLVLEVNGSAFETDTSGALVKVWTDQSGRGNDLVQQGEDTELPLLIPSGLNSYDTVKFGIGDQLRIPSTDAWDFNPGTGGFDIFMVLKVDSLGGARYLFRKGNYAGSLDEGWSIWTDDNRIIARVATDDIGDDDHKAGKTHYLTDAGQVGQWIIYNMHIGVDGDPADPNSVKLLTADVNARGTVNGQTWNGGYYISDMDMADSMYLGVKQSDIEIAEILFYNRALNAEERGNIGSYLSKKYALDTAYLPWDGCDMLWFEGAGVVEDFNRDCYIDFADFAEIAAEWLTVYDPEQ